MACACAKCNYFTAEEFRNSIKILVNSIRTNTFDLYDIFVSFVLILKKTPLSEQVSRLGDPDFDEDPHLQAYDVLCEINYFLKLLKTVVSNIYKTNQFYLMKMEYIYFLYYIQDYTKHVGHEFFRGCTIDTIPGMPGYTMKHINAEICQLVNLFADVMKQSGNINL